MDEVFHELRQGKALSFLCPFFAARSESYPEMECKAMVCTFLSRENGIQTDRKAAASKVGELSMGISAKMHNLVKLVWIH